MADRIRAHPDRVEKLESFRELEVAPEDHKSSEMGILEAHNLMTQLSIERIQLIETAYVDLLAETNA